MKPRATALSAVRLAKMFLCTSRRTQRAASRACRRARQCSLTCPRGLRAGKLKTSRRCRPVTSHKGDFYGDRLSFVFSTSFRQRFWQFAETLLLSEDGCRNIPRRSCSDTRRSQYFLPRDPPQRPDLSVRGRGGSDQGQAKRRDGSEEI